MAEMTRKDVVEFLKNRDKKKPVGHRVNYLGDKDLSGLDLSGLDLGHLDLQYIDFTNANLNSVNMDGSFFCGTKFIRANLNNVSMKNATITMTDFSGCQMSKAVLSGASWMNEVGTAYFTSCNLSGAKFIGAKLNASFMFCNLTDAVFDDATLTESSFVASILSYSSFRRVDLREIALNSSWIVGTSAINLPEWTVYGENGRLAVPALDHIELLEARQSSKTMSPLYVS